MTPPARAAARAAVSVLIPTRNAGPDFPRVLDAVRSQQGLGYLDLVVVDSGSTDDTVEIAQEYGAAVETIAPSDFSHGRTRQYGVGLTTGEAIVVMVQDALLAGPNALRNLVAELDSDERLAAVSARQLPRSDSDLYGAYILWLHERVMRAAREGGAPDEPTARRAQAAVENICAALRRAALEIVPFRDVPYGEDLDFGLRALDHGWRSTTSTTAAVVHSHDRPALYHLRRSVVDRVHGAPLFGDDHVAGPATHGLETLLGSASSLLEGLEAASPSLGDGGASLDATLLRAAELVEGESGRARPAGELAEIADLLGPANGTPECLDALRAELAGVLRWELVHEYARAQGAVDAPAARTFVSRLAGTVLGASLGDAIRVTPSDDPRVAALMEGV